MARVASVALLLFASASALTVTPLGAPRSAVVSRPVDMLFGKKQSSIVPKGKVPETKGGDDK